jgi:hypothetical protein
MPGQRLVVPEVYERCLAIPRKQHAAGRAKLAERAGNDYGKPVDKGEERAEDKLVHRISHAMEPLD